MVSFRYIAIILFCIPLFASGVERYTRDQNGIEIWGLKNAYWTVEVAPQLGGKVYSIFDNRTGREWMWSRSEDRAIAVPEDSQAFGIACLIGWDEILPTLVTSEWKGKDLPGHGELWSSELRIDDVAWKENIIRIEVNLTSLPMRYIRELSLDGDKITTRYSLVNLSAEPLPFLWALHPLFSIEAGDRIESDLGQGVMRIVNAPGLKSIAPGDEIVWPGIDQGINLLQLSLGDVPKAGLKFFIASPRDGRILLSNSQSGEKLEIRYDTTALPWLGFWIARGVWGGAHHFALEPTNSPSETIADGDPQVDSVEWLKPEELREWWLVLKSKSEV